MEGNGERGGLLSAGGILSIIVGVCQIALALVLALVTVYGMAVWQPDLPMLPRMVGLLPVEAGVPLLVVSGVVLVLGILAILGGASALKRSSFGMALIGALCSFLTVNGLGLLALIFVSLSSGEFRAGDS
ncbi:MAG: hypothetical protein GX600_06635 [Dehalococcoidia bacterium]|jgi:hypothetical protein|nr:hypothetical protein [Dehalococcoidia bacterium]